MYGPIVALGLFFWCNFLALLPKLQRYLLTIALVSDAMVLTLSMAAGAVGLIGIGGLFGLFLFSVPIILICGLNIFVLRSGGLNLKI